MGKSIKSKKLESFTSDEKIILTIIREYYGKHAINLGLKLIKLNGNQLNILLSRPGLLIGKKGRDIDKLLKILREELDNSKLTIHLEESMLNIYLTEWDDY